MYQLEFIIKGAIKRDTLYHNKMTINKKILDLSKE